MVSKSSVIVSLEVTNCLVNIRKAVPEQCSVLMGVWFAEQDIGEELDLCLLSVLDTEQRDQFFVQNSLLGKPNVLVYVLR